MADAVAPGDDYALSVCRSRRFLHGHMDDAARALFRDGFKSCGIGD
jgi:hypothetical protein